MKGRTNEFLVGTVYSRKLQPSHFLCTSHRGRYKKFRYKIKLSRGTVCPCLRHSAVYRAM